MFDDLSDCLSLTAVYMPNKNLFITQKTFIFHDFHQNLAQDQLVLVIFSNVRAKIRLKSAISREVR